LFLSSSLGGCGSDRGVECGSDGYGCCWFCVLDARKRTSYLLVILLHRLRSSKTIIVVAHSAAMKAAADVVHEIANGTLLH
jgi:hypothetical protein